MTMRFVVNTSALRREIRAPQGTVIRGMVPYIERVKRAAQAKVGVKTGNLRSRIVKRVLDGPGGAEWAVGTFDGPGPALAEWHHEGTRPHKIRASAGSSLVFFWPKVGMKTVVPNPKSFVTGRIGSVFMIGKGYVDHPGTKPNPYLRDAFRETRP